jgi:hypothetical protein
MSAIEITGLLDTPDAAFSQTIAPPQNTAARVAGFLYLVQMAAGMFGFYAKSSLMVAGNASQTAKNIIASEGMFRAGILSDLITVAAVIFLIWALYVVLKPVNSNVALLATILRLAENAIAAAGVAGVLIALRLLRSPEYLESLDAQEVHVLARLFISGHGAGLQVAFVFLGLGSAVFSWLWLRSRYIPRPLAILGIVASLLLTMGGLAVMAFPALGVIGLTYMVPMFFYEVGLGLWLLARGIHTAARVER